MFRQVVICSIAALLLCSVVAVTVPSSNIEAEELSKIEHQTTGRPCGGCPRQCYARRANAERDCAPMSPCRRGVACAVRRCNRGSGGRGFRCQGPRRTPPPLGPGPVVPPPPLSVITVPPPTFPPPVVQPPVVVVAPAPASATPSASVTPSVSPSVTPTPSVSPTSSTTPSVTPTPSPTPTNTPDCFFTLQGTPGQVAINGVCTCGTSTSSVIVLAAVNNAGMPLMDTETENNVLMCYNDCLNTQIDSKCVPSVFPFFAEQAAVTVSNCCDACRVRMNLNTAGNANPEFTPGTGVAVALNQCRLVGVV